MTPDLAVIEDTAASVLRVLFDPLNPREHGHLLDALSARTQRHSHLVPGGLYDRFLAQLVPVERWETSRRADGHPLGV